MSPSQRVLVTGGAGFIGSAVLPELQSAGHECFVLDDLSVGRRELAPVPDDRFFVTDVRDREGVSRAFATARPHAVVHLAATHFIPACNARPYEAADVNIRGTMHVLEAAASSRVERVLFASTAAVYPIHDEAIPETLPTGPLDIYGLTKATGERLVAGFHHETGTAAINCRFFNAFGPNETNPHLIPEIARQVNEGARVVKLGNLEPKRDFIHTSDMARAVRMLLERRDAGLLTVNLGRGVEYSVTELVDAFSAVVGETIGIEQDPARVRKVDRPHLLADTTRLRTLTGWEPRVSLEEGIATMVEARRA